MEEKRAYHCHALSSSRAALALSLETRPSGSFRCVFQHELYTAFAEKVRLNSLGSGQVLFAQKPRVGLSISRDSFSYLAGYSDFLEGE